MKKEFFKKNKKLFFLLPLVLISILLAIFLLKNLEQEKNISESETDTGAISIAGKIVSVGEGFFEMITQEDEKYRVDFDFQSNFNENDFVYVKGFLKAEGVLQAENTTILTREDYRRMVGDEGYARNNLEIEILDFPKKVNHACEIFTITLELRNKTSSAIVYSEIFSQDSEFSIYYVLNGVSKKATMISDFGVLESDESVEVKFVSQKDFFENQKAGEHELAFSWSQKTEDLKLNPVFYSSGVLMELLDFRCLN